MKALIASTVMLVAMSATSFAEEPSLAPDLIIVNAAVRTMDDAQLEAEAVAVSGNHIAAVGSTPEIKSLAGPKTRVIDAGGKSVLPGFNDAHVHWLMGGYSITNVDLRNATSREEFTKRIADFAKTIPKGRWILGGDWDHEKFPGTPLPTKEWIDAVTPDNPVFVNRTDGHMSLANSLALKHAKVTKETKDVPGGEIVRDAKGEPTGILKEDARVAFGGPCYSAEFLGRELRGGACRDRARRKSWRNECAGHVRR